MLTIFNVNKKSEGGKLCRKQTEQQSKMLHLILVAILSKLMVVSREAKKKQAVCNKQVSYLQVALQ